jgi:predicted ATPase
VRYPSRDAASIIVTAGASEAGVRPRRPTLEVRMIEQVQLQNILSFGPGAGVIDLKPLNVFIGPNGSGKSNLIEVIGLLRSAPGELVRPIREGGGVRDWLWKGDHEVPEATIEAVVRCPELSTLLRHRLAFTAAHHRFEVTDERIETHHLVPEHRAPDVYFGYENGRPTLSSAGVERRLERADIHPERSILAQRRDPDSYPEISYLAAAYERVRLYRDWSFGRHALPRLSQGADLPGEFLAEDSSNLALVLSTLRRSAASKRAIVDDLQQLYDGISDYEVIVEGGKAQLYLNERDRMIPATRLSDGTLRLLSMLCVLHHPTPPSLVAIEEPELGLHPDILPRLAELLQEAATRMQLIVTTHSTALVDALSDQPEAVLVAEKTNGSTSFTRLDPDDLKVWLEKYSLGELWTRGEIGGTRW